MTKQQAKTGRSQQRLQQDTQQDPINIEEIATGRKRYLPLFAFSPINIIKQLVTLAHANRNKKPTLEIPTLPLPAPAPAAASVSVSSCRHKVLEIEVEGTHSNS